MSLALCELKNADARISSASARLYCSLERTLKCFWLCDFQQLNREAQTTAGFLRRFCPYLRRVQIAENRDQADVG